MKNLILTASAALALAALTIPASAATEAESRAECEASGGTLVTTTTPWQCQHPGPAPDLTATPASAPAAPAIHTFDFEGATWTVVEGPPAAISAVHMVSGAAKACPSLKVKLESSDKGPEMTDEQKFRGDQRWHVVCVW